MRKLYSITKKTVSALLIAFACAFLLVAYLVVYSPFPVLPDGRVTYAFSSRSSNAVFINKSDYVDGTNFVGYKAKSVFIGKNSKNYSLALDEIVQIVKNYSAEAILRESVDGLVDCFYFYSDKIPFYQVVYTDLNCQQNTDFIMCDFLSAISVATETDNVDNVGKVNFFTDLVNVAKIGGGVKVGNMVKVGGGAKIKNLESTEADGLVNDVALTNSCEKKAVKVNLHVAFSDDGVSVGCPFIYCGY